MSNFTIDTKHMSRKQLVNVGRLIAKAGELDFPIDNAMTHVGYNTVYGNTYLWCEDVQYSIFISDFDSKIKACYSCPYDGEETIRNCSSDERLMNKWVEKLIQKSEAKDQ
ncbi:TPA: hypothetical protein PNT39_004547 [Salmonella enterica]|nr:hypothetical protein [Salmonella enterica]HCH9337338.1 hypothetical protein [Salmonella enterica]HCH9607977.1 hypothetical protein [Salmonella enterica]HDI5000271.1 hypothetical protein [Salmonella enterica]HDI5005092.1 hypothetical protein [Salmonella enterica]